MGLEMNYVGGFLFVLIYSNLAFGANWYFEFGSEGQKNVPEIETTFSKGELKCVVEKVAMKKQGDGSFDEQRFAACVINNVEVSLGVGCPVKTTTPYTGRAGIKHKKFFTTFSLSCGV